MAYRLWAWEPEAMGPWPVIAHQGGWDEAIFVALPMVVLAALLWVARRRAEREERQDGQASADPDRRPPPDPPSPRG